MDESRKQFEDWIANTTNSDVHRGIMLDRRDSGSYRHLATENKWNAWQASRAAIEIDLSDMHLLLCDQNDVVTELNNHGLNVKVNK